MLKTSAFFFSWVKIFFIGWFRVLDERVLNTCEVVW